LTAAKPVLETVVTRAYDPALSPGPGSDLVRRS